MQHEDSMRVVLDTNVIISGLLWKGPTKALFDLVDRKLLTVCLTPGIIGEIERVCAYPKFAKQLTSAGIQSNEIISYLLEHSLLYQDEHLVRVVKDDPSDDMFINAAIVSGSKWIISGDKHLLEIKKFNSIHIVSPSVFLRQFRR